MEDDFILFNLSIAIITIMDQSYRKMIRRSLSVLGDVTFSEAQVMVLLLWRHLGSNH